MKINTKEWLAMTELDQYMEIYRAYVRSQYKGGKPVERKIKYFEVVAEATKPFIYIFEVGKEFDGQTVDDIIEHDGVFKLFNRKDGLITEINLPVVGVRYEYPSAAIN